MSNEPYIPEADIIETLPDGRTVLVARKGVPMPLAEAKRLGFVKDAQPQGPSEIKTDGSPTPDPDVTFTPDPDVTFTPDPALESRVSEAPEKKAKK